MSASRISISRILAQPLLLPHSRCQRILGRSASNAADRDVENKKEAQIETGRIDRQSDETALSGTDDAVAQKSASFSANEPSPEVARESARKSAGYFDPLQVSPANPNISAAAAEGEYSPKTGETATYVSGGQGKTKPSVPSAGNRAFAGTDKRKPQMPGEVSRSKNATNIVKPGSR